MAKIKFEIEWQWGRGTEAKRSLKGASRACEESTTPRAEAAGKGREGVIPLPINRDWRVFNIQLRI